MHGTAAREARTLYAPWYCATSSPITKTSLSRIISSLMAEFRASRTVICTERGAGARDGRVRAWIGGTWGAARTSVGAVQSARERLCLSGLASNLVARSIGPRWMQRKQGTANLEDALCAVLRRRKDQAAG